MKFTEPFIGAVTRFITCNPDAVSDGLKQHQREAIIDALLYCLYADEFEDPAERRVMDKSIARFSWESDLSISDYVLSATEKVKRAVSTPDTEQQFLKEISRRLEDMETRFQVIQLCKVLLYSDLFFSDEEVRAITQLSNAFRDYK